MSITIENTNDVVEIAAWLKRLRTERGANARAVAEAAGIGRTTLHRWETGQAKPRLPELEATLQVLGATEAERAHARALIDVPRSRPQTGTSSPLPVPLPHRGDLIRALRLRRGWTQSVAAANMGVRQPTFAHWEAMETFPAWEVLERLCAQLNALPEERMALQSSDLIPADWQAHPDLEGCGEQVRAFERSVRAYDSPLADLHALALKRQLLRLIGEAGSPVNADEALRLLSVTNTTHSWYLQMQQRNSEANRVSWEALDLAVESRRPEAHWAEALNVASLYVPNRRTDKRAQMNLLLRWLPWFPPGSMRMRMECDIAYYASLIPGNGEEARQYLDVARATYQICDPADESDNDYFHITAGRVLAHTGWHREATRNYPAARALTAENALLLTFWAEVMAIAGEKHEAARLIADVETILTQFPLPTVRVHLNMVGRQL